ncbi:MAG: hypothetical protein AAF311_03390 [Pseudomonadota bacterium]
MTLRLLTAAAMSTALIACASSPPSRQGDRPQGERPEAGAGMAGGSVTSPLALALTGLASGPDGRIRIGNLPAAVGDMFARFDTDGSGGLSRLEHARWAEAILGDSYGRPGHMVLDRDGDGAVSQAEMAGFLETAAERMDRNSDGVLERAELIRDLPQTRTRGRRSQEGRQSGRPGRGQG